VAPHQTGLGTDPD